MDNVNLIKQAYQHFSEGKVEEVLAIMDPQIHWHEAGGFPYMRGNEPLVGPAEVVKYVFANIPEFYEGFDIEPIEIFGCGDKVVMVGYYKGKWKETGKSFKANATHVWTVVNGKVARFFQAVDTATIINP